VVHDLPGHVQQDDELLSEQVDRLTQPSTVQIVDSISIDPYAVFRKTYLISNLNSDFNPRNLHTYVLKVQGTKLVAMLDSGAQLNCISQQLVDSNKLPVYKYDKPFD
jgi:hypothetical protein